MGISRTRYARSSDGVHIAYRTVGEGLRVMVFVPGSFTHCDVGLEEPGFRDFVTSRGRLGRLVIFDKRGTGLSDPIGSTAMPALEVWMDDVTTVLDELKVPRATLIGLEAGGQMALLYAASHPERTENLVLLDTFARLSAAPDYPIGMPAEVQVLALDQVLAGWGRPAFFELVMPSRAGDEALREWYGRQQRASASPGVAAAVLLSVFESDVRAVVPTVSVPTMIVHHRDNRYVSVEHGRWLAERLPGAAYAELPGADHIFWVSDADPVVRAIAVFLPGAPRLLDPGRVLCTVLFTDIVGSTERAVELGDDRWRALLDAHDASMHRIVAEHRGRTIKSTGDGVLAVFDGPGRAVRAAQEAVRDLDARGVRIRAGLHTGEVELRGDDIGGIAVHLAARVCAVASPGEVLATRTVKDLVAGSTIDFTDRGSHQLKGIADSWQLVAVEG